MKTWDTVIVGGGIIGLSIAHALRRRGNVRVLVLERDLCGRGATAKATGGIRTQFRSETNVRLSQWSLPHFLHWGDIYGGSVEFRPVGYLFVTGDAKRFEGLVHGAEVQRRLGVRVEVVSPEDIRRLAPMVRSDDLVGGTFGPEDGLADPGAAVASLEAACRRLGVEIWERTPVTGFTRQKDAVAGVTTATEAVAAGAVVIAAGPWSRPVGKLAGVDLPVEPHHRQVYRTAAVPGLSSSPFVVDFDTGVYFHTEGDGVVFGGGDRGGPPTFDDAVRPEEAARIVELLVHRVPGLAEASLMRMWAGLREMTPDDHGLLGPVPGIGGLYVAAGFSGHGFMQAPAIGEAMACLLTGEPPPFDLSALSLERFQHEVRGETYVF